MGGWKFFFEAGTYGCKKRGLCAEHKMGSEGLSPCIQCGCLYLFAVKVFQRFKCMLKQHEKKFNVKGKISHA